MLMNNFLKDRKSIRDFKNKKISRKTLNQIEEKCNQAAGDGFEFTLLEDGKKIFKSLEGIGGYAGVMIKSPHYIGLNIKAEKKDSIIYSAYNMECLITEFTKMNIGSCWISLKKVDSNVKKDLFRVGEGNVEYLLAIGYAAAKNPFISEPASSRISLDDMVYNKEIGKQITIDELEHRGLNDLFYYIRFAPSSHNKQPWRFLLMDDKVILLLAYCEGDKISYIDAGIIMYYFENLTRVLGITNKWDLIDKPDCEVGEYRYKEIAKIKL